MKYIGKAGEYRVLARLLERDVEAYPAIKINQTGYDITAVLRSGKVVRIQVKSTELDNRSTNNSVNVGDGFDFLVVVIFDGNSNAEFYVMTRYEALKCKGTNSKLSLTKKNENCQSGGYRVTDDIDKYRDKWDEIQIEDA